MTNKQTPVKRTFKEQQPTLLDSIGKVELDSKTPEYALKRLLKASPRLSVEIVNNKREYTNYQ